MLHPTRTLRRELQLSPSFGLTTKNTVAALHRLQQLLTINVLRIVLKQQAMLNGINRKTPHTTAQMTPGIHIPVVAVMNQLLRRNDALHRLARLPVEVNDFYLLSIDSSLSHQLKRLQWHAAFASVHHPNSLRQHVGICALRFQNFVETRLQRLELGAQQARLELTNHGLNGHESQRFFLAKPQARELLKSVGV